MAHAEQSLHLLLEFVNVLLLGAGDDEIINTHPDDDCPLLHSSCVRCMLGGAPGEAERSDTCIKLDVPSLWCVA